MYFELELSFVLIRASGTDRRRASGIHRGGAALRRTGHHAPAARARRLRHRLPPHRSGQLRNSRHRPQRGQGQLRNQLDAAGRTHLHHRAPSLRSGRHGHRQCYRRARQPGVAHPRWLSPALRRGHPAHRHQDPAPPPRIHPRAAAGRSPRRQQIHRRLPRLRLPHRLHHRLPRPHRQPANQH